MFISEKDMQSEKRENMRGGEGVTGFLHIVSKEHLPEKARLFSLITLEKGCSIGKHEHNGESEIYYVLSGEGEIDDNGALKRFAKGDCAICRSGEYHAVSNNNDEPLKFIAAIILE
jgi:quercetin dioxygenase-like cupin family protein